MSKSENSIDSKQPHFFLIGISVSIGLVITAFQWETPAKEHLEKEITKPYENIVYVQATRIKKPEQKLKEIEHPKKKEGKINIVKKDINVQKTTESIVLDTLSNAPDINPTEGIEPNFIDSTFNPYSLTKMAQFPGGEEAMKKFIVNNFNLNNKAKMSTNGGMLYVEFIIDKDGSVTNVHLLNSLSNEIDRIAVATIKSMPSWEPAEHKGFKVKMKYQIPINIKLQ